MEDQANHSANQSCLSAEEYQKEYVPENKERLRNGIPCAICVNGPTQIAIFDLEGAQVIEGYCDTCVANVIEDRIPMA